MEQKDTYLKWIGPQIDDNVIILTQGDITKICKDLLSKNLYAKVQQWFIYLIFTCHLIRLFI